jgi:hypothetical protein
VTVRHSIENPALAALSGETASTWTLLLGILAVSDYAPMERGEPVQRRESFVSLASCRPVVIILCFVDSGGVPLHSLKELETGPGDRGNIRRREVISQRSEVTVQDFGEGECSWPEM